MNFRLLARSFAIAMVFSILLLVTGSVGITVYALALETDISVGSVYAVSFDHGGFYVTAGPGLFLTFVVVLALLTLLISIGQSRPAAQDR